MWVRASAVGERATGERDVLVTPANATFQQWQTTQLHTLQTALRQAGR